MKTFEIDLRYVTSFEDFISAFNKGFCFFLGSEWKGNLDAFNDYFWWPEERPYTLILHGSEICAKALDHNAQAEWLKQRISKCHPTNVSTFQADLERAYRKQGMTLYERLLEIIQEHDFVNLILD